LKKLFLSLLLIILLGNSVFAQSTFLNDSIHPLKYNLSQFGSETWEFVKSPLKWNAGDFLKIGVAGAGTFLLMKTVDQPVRDVVLKNNSVNYNSVPIEAGRIWGELYMPIVLFTGFGLHSVLTGDISTRKIAYEVGQASIYGGIITYILKYGIGRARPYVKEGTSSYRPFYSFFSDDRHSFPGGHNVAGFILSTVLSRNAKPIWLKILAYVPAALTFVSRVYQDKHWTSDELAGSALGFAIATWVVNHHENQKTTVTTGSTMMPLSFSIIF